MSNVSVSMKMSPKKAGQLYMKAMQLEDRVKELEAQLEEAHQVTTNHVKREVAIEAYLQSASDFCVEDDVSFEAHQYAEHKYPSVKDGE